MTGFLKSLFETKAAGTSEADAIARATGSSTGASYGSWGMGLVGPWDIDQAVKNGLEKVTWVFRCVDVIAQNQASLMVRQRKGFESSSEPEWIDDERLNLILNYKTNNYERAWQFRYRLSAILLLARRGAFIEIMYGKDGRPSQLHLLPPGVTQPIPDPKTFVSGYRIQRSDWKTEEVPAFYPNGKPRVLWIRLKPHPTDPYAQMTPLMTAGIAAETDYFAHLFNRNFLMNDGRPGLLVNISGQVSVEDAREIKRKLGGGPLRAGEIAVIESPGISVEDMARSPRDVQWDEMLKISKEEILMSFGVPESVMGNASGRTFDNADAERENFWMDTMVPHCNSVAQGLDGITESTEDTIVLQHDFDKVDVLQRIKERKRQNALAEFSAGAITIDEYRKVAGYTVWDVVGTRVLYLNSGIAVAKNPTDQAAIMTLKPLVQPAGAAGQVGAGPQYPALPSGLQQRALTLVKGARESGPKSIEKKDAASGDDDDIIEGVIVEEEKTHPYLGLRHNLEGFVEGALESWDSRQEDIITSRLMHVKSRKGTRHWDGESTGEVKALDPNYAVNSGEWVADLRQAMTNRMARAIKAEATRVLRDLDSMGLIDEGAGNLAARHYGSREAYNAALQKVLDQSLTILEGAAQRQSRRVADRIKEMDANGATMRQIEAEVRRSIGLRAGWRKALATNLVTSVVEGTRFEVYSQAGGRLRKVWNATPDERTRHTHVAADGQVRSVNSRFRVGKAWMMHPGDTSAPAEEVVNCRCWTSYTAV